MIAVGLDASSTCTGWSVFRDNKLIDYGAIKPKGQNWQERVYNEKPELEQVFKKYHPDKIFMENVPLKASGGLKTLVILGGVQGFIYGVAASNNIPIEFVDPNTWRSMGGVFDGTQEGKKRDHLKQRAIEMANEKFGLNLLWVSPKSTKNQDDIAEAILICAIMLGLITKKKKFGKNKGPKSQS